MSIENTRINMKKAGEIKMDIETGGLDIRSKKITTIEVSARQFGKSEKQRREILEGFKSYLADQNWHSFASSFGANKPAKSLEVQIGGRLLRVVIDKEIVYEGFDPIKAVNLFSQ